ncbi:hypothetical protein GCM10011519_13970 [Marmoricola endophyticus]|uniref:DNA ligase D 3'-phosphoesterase domain-containing protein n=1 Tax=Marmoricola endophyticus TaxID=2040280 RepID=A0A917BHB3_9ACTN|nr:DNA polymerase ligase N-terminal domain-containing protein [Marmoricola endophyticus]GGF41389.1 hypothetical protein GCM10011519_13970 [Marmoricola endophyticus]
MSAPVFVVQRHEATALHYDLRLEIEGVLVSWAVPKGPSLDPGVRRFARRVGDHDLAHADFEGVAGSSRRHSNSVVVWDTGTYENRSRVAGKAVSAADALGAGHLVVRLEGSRLHGGFALTRVPTGPRSARADAWLLVKVDDEHADRDADLSGDLPSVLSGRTNAEVAAAEGPDRPLPDPER